MGSRTRTIVSWSTGKDAAWALHRLSARGDISVVGLLTVINRDMRRASMHAVRESLIERQAAAIELPLIKVYVPHPCSDTAYRTAMIDAIDQAKRIGVEAIAFGDLYLEDARRYRERLLSGTGVRPLFPLWGADTRALAREMIEAGLRAVVTCVDPDQIDPSVAGETYGTRFVEALPHDVDACGEKGEFHTFACDGPMFRAPVAVTRGRIVRRDGFVFCDLQSPRSC